MTIVEVIGPSFGSREWFKYWMRHTKEDIVYELRRTTEEYLKVKRILDDSLTSKREETPAEKELRLQCGQ